MILYLIICRPFKVFKYCYLNAFHELVLVMIFGSLYLLQRFKSVRNYFAEIGWFLIILIMLTIFQSWTVMLTEYAIECYKAKRNKSNELKE